MLSLVKTTRCGSMLCRAWMSSATAVEEQLLRGARTGGSCTVPLAYTKFEAKEKQGENKKALAPILLLHGLLGSQMTYRSLVKRKDFAPMRETFTVDLRNHGLSPHVGEMNLQALMRDVVGFMDNEGLEKVCPVGHSVGGKVGMMLALEHPERVSELVVIDICPGDSVKRSEETVMVAVQAMHDIDIENYRQKADIDLALQEKGVKDERVRQFLMTNLISDDSDPGFYKWKLHIQAIQEGIQGLQSFPTYEDGTVYKGPTLFAYGDRSNMLTKNDEALVKKFFPNAIMKEIQNAGHWLQADQPEAFCASLNAFLGDDK